MAATKAQAQERVNIQDLVIKDSTGAVCPPQVWMKLMNSGQYWLKLSADKKTATVTRLTDEQMAARPKTTGSTQAREGTSAIRESPFFTTGAKIASFNEKDMKGERFNLKEMVGKVVVLNFWFINCPPCRMEIPELNQLVETYKSNQDVVFIAIALDPVNELEDFLKTTPFNYHIIPNGRYTAGKYGIGSYPTHVVLNKEGKVAFHTTGLSSATVGGVKSAIETALKSGITQ